MFTGIIEEVGTIKSVNKDKSSYVFQCACQLAGSLKYGDSVAVNGVCQTVLEKDKNSFTFQSISDTLKSTNLIYLKQGSEVNLERAITLSTPLNGHLVQGHVDRPLPVTDIQFRQEPLSITIKIENSDMKYVVPKGSIAIDGISLTIQEIKGLWLKTGIIRHTIENTRLKSLKPGDLVNVEFDIIGKYIVQSRNPYETNNDTLKLLQENGFIK